MTGVNRFAYEMCKSLFSISDLDIILLCPRNINPEYDVDKFKILYWGTGTSHFWEQFVLPLFFLFKRKYLLINFSGLGPIIIKRQFITIHDISFWEHPSWFAKTYYYYYRLLTPCIAKRSEHILTVSQFSMNEILKHINIPKDKISVIYNAVSENFYSNRFITTKAEKKNYILSIGSIEPRKNFLKLIEAYNKLNIDIDLLIIGKTNKIFRKIDLSCDKTPVFINHLTDHELISIYSDATLFIYPSVYEGFGLPPLEAIAAGCPAIVSDIDVFHEVFDNSVLYFNPHDSDDISKCIEYVLNNPEAITDFETKREMIIEKYNWNKSCEKLIGIINKYRISTKK